MTDPTYDELLDIVDAQRKLIESLGRKNQWLMEQMPIRRADLLAALGAPVVVVLALDVKSITHPPYDVVDFYGTDEPSMEYALEVARSEWERLGEPDRIRIIVVADDE